MKTSTLIRRYVLPVCLLLTMLIASSNSVAQRINTLQVTQFSGGYSTIIIQPGSVYLGGNGIYYPYDVNPPRYVVTMPFAFKFDNTTYASGSALYVHFGSVSFTDWTTTQPPYFYTVTNPTQIGQPASVFPNGIAPLTGLQISGGVYYLVSGASPNRVLTVEWYQSGDYPSRANGTCSYQLKLYEGSNTIEFIYGKYNFMVGKFRLIVPITKVSV